MDDKLLMNRLRQILLAEDREELQRLKDTLNDPVLLSKKVSPLIEEHLEFMRENFPGEYRLVVDSMIEAKLKASREEILDTISPVMGRMIRKYIQHQFQELKETMEQQLRKRLEGGIIGRLRRFFFGFEPKEMTDAIFSSLNGPKIDEIFVIEQHSGILLGSASRHDTVDLDMIAGMLTAIRSFVEDAFRQGTQNLEQVHYETYSILLENYHSYYIATAVEGSISAKERRELSEQLGKFVEEELNINLKKNDGSPQLLIKNRLEHYFFEPQKAILPKENI